MCFENHTTKNHRTAAVLEWCAATHNDLFKRKTYNGSSTTSSFTPEKGDKPAVTHTHLPISAPTNVAEAYFWINPRSRCKLFQLQLFITFSTTHASIKGRLKEIKREGGGASLSLPWNKIDPGKGMGDQASLLPLPTLLSYEITQHYISMKSGKDQRNSSVSLSITQIFSHCDLTVSMHLLQQQHSIILLKKKKKS